MKYDVFISYASGDRETADKICEILEGGGLTCWIAPRDVSGNYGAAIIKGIESSEMMVLVFSSKANESTFVHREVERAANKHRTIYVVRIEDVPAADELELFISADQWFDASSSTLAGRREELVQNVKQQLGKSNGHKRTDRRAASWLDQLGKLVTPSWAVWAAIGIVLSMAVWRWGIPLIRGTGASSNQNDIVTITPTPPVEPANKRTPTQNTQHATPVASPTALPSPSTQPIPVPKQAVVESLEDTQWEFSRVGRKVEYIWEFHPEGRWRTRRFLEGTYLDDGTWKQEGDAVTLRYGPKESPETYKGTIRGNHMEGIFIALKSERWTAKKIEP